MKRTVFFTAAICTAMVAYQFVHSEETSPPTTAPATTQPFGDQYKTASYGMGYDLGKNMKQMKIALDPKLISQGMEDALAGTESKVTPEQFEAAMTAVQQEMMANMAVQQKEVGDKASSAGDDFRKENAKKPGVVTTASGLQIETIKEGTGATPTPANTVKVHYTGTLVDGTKFDSSVDRGQPAEFPVGGVIKGWTEALQTMKVGGKAHLVIPPDIAYGPRGQGPIPPNATLVFDVELLDIVK